MTDHLRDILQRHPMFSAVRPELLDTLLGHCREQAFSSGDLLFAEAAESNDALLLLSGSVDVSIRTDHGTVVLSRIASTTLFGEIGVFTGLPRTATVRGASTGTALWLDGEALRQCGESAPCISRYVIRQLGERIDSFNRATGFYTNALAALKQDDPDVLLIDSLINPPPELVQFAAAFRQLAEHIIQRKAQRIEMANAEAMQRALLPHPLPSDGAADRFDMHAHLQSARDVGGDFYDAFLLDDDRLIVLIGDVSGKGIAASLFMAVCRTILRASLRQTGDLASALTLANRSLEADTMNGMFATFCLLSLDLRTGGLEYCNGGHPPPIISRAGGEQDILPLTALPLAIMPDLEFSTGMSHLGRGDHIVLYTDGITEAENKDADLYGEHRLRDFMPAVDAASMRDAVLSVVHEVGRFAGDAEQSDDIACVMLKYKG